SGLESRLTEMSNFTGSLQFGAFLFATPQSQWLWFEGGLSVRNQISWKLDISSRNHETHCYLQLYIKLSLALFIKSHRNS
ncbi:hypothetical protein, partial [Vibrio sp. IB15]|uniref:hypothetical protein n=1 Tax=Vibrio sp. IB15 TaxID=2779368 RepID=UPI001E56273F